MTISTSALYSTTSASFRNGNGGGNGNGSKHHSPLLITGRDVFAHTNSGTSQRGGLAAQLALDEARLVKPTVAQAAVLTHATIQNTYDAMHLAPKTRELVAAGEISLAEAAKANGLVAAWIAATPAEKAALGNIVGVAEIWDAAIQPLT